MFRTRRFWSQSYQHTVVTRPGHTPTDCRSYGKNNLRPRQTVHLRAFFYDSSVRAHLGAQEHGDWITATAPSRTSHANETSGRTLVLCFDGTGDKFDSDVSHLISCLINLCKWNFSEFKCRSVFCNLEENRNPKADGLLSGTFLLLQKPSDVYIPSARRRHFCKSGL